MKFGLYLENEKIQLIDIETGEVLAEGAETCQTWLQAYSDNYTLQLV